MIDATNLNKKFGRLQVLKDVTLRCNSGECIALIGPNGSGKTTLIKCILGMVVHDSGSIFFDGVDVRDDWKYRAQIGYMPQIGRYPDNMTIGQVIDMMRDIRGGKEINTDEELIDAFGLSSMMQKRMRTLSGGTRQKVSACLAFLFHPKVLILDEPTAGLDPHSSEILKEKISREKENGKLIIITSHILSELDDLVTEVIYMQEGQVRFHKSIGELQVNTGHRKLAKAIASIV
jgi:Cu-processing system ATP-binding protein